MKGSWTWPIVGWVAAVAITTAMDAMGASTFSALPLFPLFVLFWLLQRLPTKSVGMSWGGAKALRWYMLSILYPIAVMGAIGLIAALTGALHSTVAPPHKHSLWFTVPVNIVSGLPVALLTEEGFFRGWLWASLERTGQRALVVLVLTSVAFALWHWSSVVLPTAFNPPMAQVPFFMINATIIGANWGMLRLLSGSVVVSSVSHSIWNGLAYSLFGYGTSVGALGIADTALYGPEIGVLGLVFNAVVAATLLVVCRREGVLRRG